MKALEDPAQQAEVEDPKKRKAEEVVVGPQLGGGMPKRHLASAHLPWWC